MMKSNEALFSYISVTTVKRKVGSRKHQIYASIKPNGELKNTYTRLIIKSADIDEQIQTCTQERFL